MAGKRALQTFVGNRFLKSSIEDGRRRRHRALVRRGRAAASRQTASQKPRDEADRHWAYPCCGKRRYRCTCFQRGGRYHHVAQACRRRNLQTLRAKLLKATLLNKNDTVDVSILASRYGAEMRKNIVWAFYWSVLCRLYNKQSTWKCWEEFRVYPPAARQPDWCALRLALATLYERQGQGESIHGGLYRTPKLIQYRFHMSEDWETVDPDHMSKATRDWNVLNLLWQSLPQYQLREYGREPSSASWASFYDTFRCRVAERVKGLFDDYMMKVTLDPLMATGVIKDAHLSRWPADCPGYQPFLHETYPGIPKSGRLGCLYHLHWEISHRYHFNVNDTVAQLCWDHRRASGALRD